MRPFDRLGDVHGREMELRWRTQLGDVYRIEQMSSTHIRNSMKMLLRQAEDAHNFRTVAAFKTVIESGVDLGHETESERAAVEYMFDHLRVTPKEWMRRTEMMYAFHHELQRRRNRLGELMNDGVATFEMPPR